MIRLLDINGVFAGFSEEGYVFFRCGMYFFFFPCVCGGGGLRCKSWDFEVDFGRGLGVVKWTVCGSGGKGRRRCSKMNVQEYLDQHDVSKVVETAINACVKARPEDPTVFIANYLRNQDGGGEVKITKVVGRQIIDSRGNPTVEADVHTTTGMYRAAVPSGASTGIYEAVELRDKGSAWMGKGVMQAVANVNDKINPALKGMNPTEQKKIDEAMITLDGTDNKGSLGANAILAVSLAVCKAGAAANDVPLYKHIADLAGNSKLVLPVPAFNIINGGSHAGNALAMQEFMILPVGASNFTEAMQMGCEVYHNLKALIKEKYGQDACNVGDEGGFAPNIGSNEEGLNLVNAAIEKAGYTGMIMLLLTHHLG